MEDTEIVKSFWNKTTEELTVKDQLALVVLAPAVALGAVAAFVGVVAVGDKIASKFRKKNKVEELTVIDDTEKTES